MVRKGWFAAPHYKVEIYIDKGYFEVRCYIFSLFISSR